MLAYVETRQKIINYIKKNNLKVSDRLPSEKELSEFLGIGRLTLREAVNALKNEGIITSIQGKGTYIACNVDNISNTMNNNLGITEMIVASGYKPGVSHFEKKLLVADKCVADRLRIKAGTDVLVLKRIRTADGKPVVYSMDYMAPRLSAEFLSITDENVSIYEFLEEKCRVKIGMGIAEIVPYSAEDWLAQMLDIEIGTPLLVLKQIVNDMHGSPIIYAKEYVRPDSFKLLIYRRRAT
jgi:GntR family transcriptional regulator